jgi:hypothetical protein
MSLIEKPLRIPTRKCPNCNIVFLVNSVTDNYHKNKKCIKK